MDKEGLRQSLRVIAIGQDRPKAALFREVFDDVQSALFAGVKRENVRAELARHGLQLTERTFDSLLTRTRRERGIVGRKKARVHAAPPMLSVDEANGGAAASPPAKARPAAPVIAAGTALGLRANQAEGNGLPEDWRTGVLTAEQRRRLTAEQRKERDDVQREMAFPRLRPLGEK